jgi:homocysteine S-methyltransferase
VAHRDSRGIVLETPTWRANAYWGSRLGYGPEDLDRINRAAVGFIRSLRRDDSDVEIVISGNVGPRGDGYVTGETMTFSEAADYHAPQIRSFAAAEADLVTAMTLTYTDEAIGIAQAASQADIASVISFTVETDGALPSGQPLAEAINHVDDATSRAPAYYMVNCAHPTHFQHLFEAGGPWERVRGIRANASSMSHEELDNAEELDRGDQASLADQYRSLHDLLPALAVVGGCCGTDHHHIGAISAAVGTTTT